MLRIISWIGVPVVRPSNDAGQDLDLVGLAPLGGVAALARLAAVEPDLDLGLVETATPGGQPSTVAPSAGPWLSPQVVTRKTWPKVLKLMRLPLAPRALAAKRLRPIVCTDLGVPARAG